MLLERIKMYYFFLILTCCIAILALLVYLLVLYIHMLHFLFLFQHQIYWPSMCKHIKGISCFYIHTQEKT